MGFLCALCSVLDDGKADSDTGAVGLRNCLAKACGHVPGETRTVYEAAFYFNWF